MMTEREFLDLADSVLNSLQTALDAADLDLDYQLNGGVLEIEFDSGAKIIVNRHVPNQEIWVAAKSGGFHFAPNEDGRWMSTREHAELQPLVSQLIADGAGSGFDWA
jgi:CyaY protein